MKKMNNIPTMTPVIVHDYLRNIGNQWTGQGVAMELGSWLGATAAPLLEGLVEAGYDKTFWAFDRWRADLSEVEKASQQGVVIQRGQNLRGIFYENVTRIYPKVKGIQGRLPGILREYNGDSIEICLFDAPKRGEMFQECMRKLMRYWMPGVTVFGMMDYYFYQHKEGLIKRLTREPVEWMERHSDNFERLQEWPNESESVFFRYIKPINHD